MPKCQEPLIELLIEGFVTVVSMVLIWLFWCIAQKESFRSAGITGQGAVIETSIGFLLGVVVSGSAVLGLSVLGAYHILQINAVQSDFYYYLAIFLFVGLNEELVFRIFIFNTLEKRWGTTTAVVLTSTIFGLLHLINTVPGATGAEKLCGCIFLIFEAGFLFNAAYLVKRSIWLPFGLHWAWNFFEGPVFGAAVSGTSSGAPLIGASIQGPFLLSGGAFGPEASLAGLGSGILIGAGLAYYSIKRGAWTRNSDDSMAN